METTVAPTAARAPSRRLARRGRARSAVRLGRARLRQAGTSQTFLLLAFTLLAAATTFLVALANLSLSAMIVVLMLGGFMLRMRSLLLLYLVVASGTVYVLTYRGTSNMTAPWVLAACAALVLAYARSREQLGVQGTIGESMLVDLRDRLRLQGKVPELPAGWQVERVLRSAFGDAFSGDFLVTSRSGDLLEMVLVDVSGKGQAAGTRSLLLSGAFGGLLGAMPPGEFMAAANAYLLRQRWPEGFATAVHVAIDVVTGDVDVSSAGHPPAVQFHAGSGRWELSARVGGPALGIIEDADFPAHRGRLERGDALLLYTDGLIETPGRDIDLGIDRLVGQAEREVSGRHLRGMAERIVAGTRTDETDDRALVVVWRE